MNIETVVEQIVYEKDWKQKEVILKKYAEQVRRDWRRQLVKIGIPNYSTDKSEPVKQKI